MADLKTSGQISGLPRGRPKRSRVDPKYQCEFVRWLDKTREGFNARRIDDRGPLQPARVPGVERE